MSNEVTVYDLLELEAYADTLKEKARMLRLKLEGKQTIQQVPEMQVNESFKEKLRAYKLEAILKDRADPY